MASMNRDAILITQLVLDLQYDCLTIRYLSLNYLDNGQAWLNKLNFSNYILLEVILVLVSILCFIILVNKFYSY